MAHRPFLVHLMLALAAGAASAQDVRQYRAGDSVDPREVAAILGQPQPGAPAMKMRSIRLLDEASPAAKGQELALTPAPSGEGPEAPDGDPPAPRTAALSLPVQFGFDSADILPGARQQLDALAAGIGLLPATQPVVIQGHTDAVGTEQYNEQLSNRRAQAVKRYLVAAHGIDPARLRAVGMGEHAPLPGRDRNAPENRRVQFSGE